MTNKFNNKTLYITMSPRDFIHVFFYLSIQLERYFEWDAVMAINCDFMYLVMQQFSVFFSLLI
mgnify:FL=1